MTETMEYVYKILSPPRDPATISNIHGRGAVWKGGGFPPPQAVRKKVEGW